LNTYFEITAPFVFTVEYDGTNRSESRHFIVRKRTESTLGEIRDLLALMSLEGGMSAEFLPRNPESAFDGDRERRPLAGIWFRIKKAEAVYEADSELRVVRATCEKIVSVWSDACSIFDRGEELPDTLSDVVKDFESRGFEVIPKTFEFGDEGELFDAR